MRTGFNKENTEIPHDPKVESSILGAVIFDNVCYSEISSILSRDDFYSSVHGKIYETMGNILQEGGVLDETVLSSRLKSLDLLENIGGTEYINTIKESACHKHLVRGYSEIVKGYSLKRSIANITEKYLKISTNKFNDDDPKLVVSELIGELSSVSVDKNSSAGFASTEDLFDDLFEGGSGRIIYTGLDCIDREFPIMTSGVTIIAGRPSHGKSTLALAAAIGMANNGYRVDTYSFEMTKGQIASRLASLKLREQGRRIPYTNIYRQDLRSEIEDNDILLIRQNIKDIAPMNVNDASTMTASDIMCNSLYSKKIKDKPDCIIIDYLSKVSKSDMRGSDLRDDQKIGSIVKRLRDFGKNIDCAVIIVVQLGREVERRSEMGRPFLGALKNSGEIEEHADTVIFPYRQCRYIEQKYGDSFQGNSDISYEDYIDLKSKMEVICAKQRMGSTGSKLVHCEIEHNYIECED